MSSNVGLGACIAWTTMGKNALWIGVWFPFMYLFIASMYEDNKFYLLFNATWDKMFLTIVHIQ